jgi:IPT/TIG domain
MGLLGLQWQLRASCASARALVSPKRAVLLAVGTTAVLAAGTASASAIIVQRPNGHRISYQPTRRAARFAGFAGFSEVEGNAEYHGGPVMTSNTNYALYWDPPGAPAYPAGYQAGLNRWFEDLAHDSGGVQNTDSVLTQYKDSLGESAKYESTFGGALIDEDPYPPSGCAFAGYECLTEEQIDEEITHYVETNGLPQDLSHEYFLLTPEGVESCFDATENYCSVGIPAPEGFCAYHNFVSAPGGPIVIANDPFLTEPGACVIAEEQPNESVSDHTLNGGLAHEHSESITDPELNAWYGEGGEVGDKCSNYRQLTELGNPLGHATDGAQYNQVVNGHFYLYQQEWSNANNECLQRAASGTPPTVKKLSPKKGHAAGGTLVTITGTNLAGATEVFFGRYRAEEVKDVSATVVQAISPAQPKGSVFVTVGMPAGSSAPTKKGRFKVAK